MGVEAASVTRQLTTQGHTLVIVPQNLYEFWVVATRPVANNGLGRSAAETAADIAYLRRLFTLLDDVPAIYPAWERLVTAHAVLGKTAHDARLVAAMLTHGVTHMLTFNGADFRRFAAVTVLTPAGVFTAAAP